jgi:glycosyltransferase involved in cell wall biosynthesis
LPSKPTSTSAPISTLFLSKNRRHVITIHDISFAYFPEFFPRRKNLWHAEQGWQQQVKEAGRVITVSDATRENILDLFHLPEEKVVRIYPGIKKDCRPLPKDTPGLVDFRDKYFLQAPFFLYVGTLEPRKNLIGLVRAFNIVKAKPANRDLKLVVAGAPGWLYDKIFKEIKASPHSNDIVVWGPATEEEILNLYNLATAFVYPSFFEGFGFPPLEAQKCGCPVVASNRSSLPEVLGSSALLADPYRLEELASAMEAAATDGELRKELIKKGFENSARFAWEKTVGETVKIFKAINI